MFVAELEHPRVRPLRSQLAAQGRHVRRAMPHRADEARGRAHAHRAHDHPYGQTESSPVITMSSVDDPFELRVTTVGTPLANTEVQIVDPETRQRLPIGDQGELCTRGYLVMKGYDEDPEATAGGHRRRGLAAHRRPGGDAARRLLQLQGPRQGHHHSRRRKHLSARGGGFPAHQPQGRRRLRGGPARRQAGRDRAGVDSIEDRRASHGRRKSAISAAARSPTSRFPNTSASWTASRRRSPRRCRSSSSGSRRFASAAWKRSPTAPPPDADGSSSSPPFRIRHAGGKRGPTARRFARWPSTRWRMPSRWMAWMVLCWPAETTSIRRSTASRAAPGRKIPIRRATRGRARCCAKPSSAIFPCWPSAAACNFSTSSGAERSPARRGA